MNLSHLLKKSSQIAANNSPHILTALAVTGVAATAYFTGKATFKAAELLSEHEYEIELSDQNKTRVKLDPREKVELVWRLYVPAIGTGVMTVVCIVAANRIGTRRAAAVASAYAITQKAFEQYKDKVIETVGEKKNQAIEEALVQDELNNRPVPVNTVIITSGDEELCFDRHTGRYFKASYAALQEAKNKTNEMILNNFYASLSDFYDYLGLPRTDATDAVGWNSDKLMDLEITAGISSDNRPCLSIGFRVVPIHHYNRIH